MHTPLPSFSWANGSEVWEFMLEKDATYSKLRSEKILEHHPSLVDSYRTILFDWLSEVSHECKFHRETYHLALDFIDRYLAATTNVVKYQLQLIGTTCLFLAAKYEEIRPPTVTEFAELTDGACKPEEIIDHEVVILSAINWDITPLTPNSWLNIYMQILSNLDQDDDTTSTTISTTEEVVRRTTRSELITSNSLDQYCNEENSRSSIISTRSLGSVTRSSSRRASKRQKTYSDRAITSTTAPASTTTSRLSVDEDSVSQCEFRLARTRNDSFILPTNNGFLRYNHKRIASVVDLALLHIESLRFSNSILTAAALYHFTTQQTIRQCSGYNYEQLAECIHWLEPFVETVREIQEPVFIASCKGIRHPTQMHSHIATASMLDEVKIKIETRRYHQMQSAALKRKAFELENDDGSNDAQVTSASGVSIQEHAGGRVIVLGGNNLDSLAISPLKPSTTVLLTPPSSTCKARGRQNKRQQHQLREQQRKQHSARGNSFRFAPQVRSLH